MRMQFQIILLSFIIASFVIHKDIPPIEESQDDLEIIAINNLVDRWHKAAADADFDTFFNCMDEDAYYIGTDESEKWSTKEFKAFCKPYFDKGSAWDFKSFDRAVYLTDEKNYAWFDEKLNTWMGVCRSSGVLIKTLNGWKIKHYQLSMTVPNDLTRDFIQMVEQYKAKNTK